MKQTDQEDKDEEELTHHLAHLHEYTHMFTGDTLGQVLFIAKEMTYVTTEKNKNQESRK